MVVSLLPAQFVAEASGDTGEFTVTGDSDSYSYSDNTLIISGSDKLTISGTTTTDKIVVEENAEANITLAGVYINYYDGYDYDKVAGTCAFEVLGTANITLAEGSENVLQSGVYKAGLQVEDGATVVIDGTGSLNASSKYAGAGIGGGNESDGGNITISGGNVTATSEGSAAAIGGGYNGDGGTITISGGEVTATGDSYAAGIGGGLDGASGTIDITRGKVTATGGLNAAGIGSGPGGACTYITITGGEVTATGGEGGAGIGCGASGFNGAIEISGGNVTATGGENGAGIGGGSTGTDTTIVIYDGKVTATGGENAAGIGSGSEGEYRDIEITGGEITATGGKNAAGIGSGSGGSDGNIQIRGGNVTAIGGSEAAGIGDGHNGSGATFNTGSYGFAIIKASSISDRSEVDRWEGVIFEDGIGEVYSDTTFYEDFTVEEGEVLTVDNEITMRIYGETIFTNNGTLICNGEIDGYGTLSGDGKFLSDVFNENDVEDIEDQIYTGYTIEPDVTIVREFLGIDFTVDMDGWTTEYSNNIEKGTATITFEKDGEEDVTKTFEIVDEKSTWELVVVPITEETDGYYELEEVLSQYSEEVMLFDIYFINRYGERVEYDTEFEVEITVPEEFGEPEMYFIGTDESTVKMDTSVADGKISFTTNSIGYYGIVDMEKPLRKGDANGDGRVDSIDLILVKSYIIGNYDSLDTENCDLDEDGIIGLEDVIIYNKYILGEITEI